MVRADRDGQHPLYRERDWQEADRRQQRQKKKTNRVVSENSGPVKIKIQEPGGIEISSKIHRINTNKPRDAAVMTSSCASMGEGRVEKAGGSTLVMY